MLPQDKWRQCKSSVVLFMLIYRDVSLSSAVTFGLYWISDMSTCSVFISLRETDRKCTQQLHMQTVTWEPPFSVGMFMCSVILGWLSVAFKFKMTEEIKETGLLSWNTLTCDFSYILPSQFYSPIPDSLKAKSSNRLFMLCFYELILLTSSACSESAGPVSGWCANPWTWLWKGYWTWRRTALEEENWPVTRCASLVEWLHLLEERFSLPHGGISGPMCWLCLESGVCSWRPDK